MNESVVSSNPARQWKQAFFLWLVFFLLAVLFNGTIPFVFGADLHAWTQSPLKTILVSFVFYAVLFLAVPLILIKGWPTVRRADFLYPLCLAMLAITFWVLLRGLAAIAILVLVYLHWRFDLSDYGIRSRGWRGDLLAVLIMGLLGLIPALMRTSPSSGSFGAALATAMDRWFVNPASTVENLFYFGFLTERLSQGAGKWLTPPLIGLLYTAHEMSNPEYWYGSLNFVLVFVGVSIWSAIYLWRRSAVIIWLGDGFYRFVGRLI